MLPFICFIRLHLFTSWHSLLLATYHFCFHPGRLWLSLEARRLSSAGEEALVLFQSWRLGRGTNISHLFLSPERVLSNQIFRDPLWSTLCSPTLLQEIVLAFYLKASLGIFPCRLTEVGGLGRPHCGWREPCFRSLPNLDPHLCLLTGEGFRFFIGSLSHWGSASSGVLSQLPVVHGNCGAGLSPCLARGTQSPACLSASLTQACASSQPSVRVPPGGQI